MTTNSEPENANKMIDKVTLCFDVQSDIAMRLYKKSIETKKSTNYVINTILDDYFRESDQKEQMVDMKEHRGAPRIKVSIPAVMEIQLSENETQYKPVHIVNVSSTGVGIQMGGQSPRIIDKIRSNNIFILIFSIRSMRDIVCAICKPAYINVKKTMEIGASFKSMPNEFNHSLCL